MNFTVVSVLALLPTGNIKLREFWSVTVEVLFIGYPANDVVSNMLGHATGLKERFRIHKSDIKTDKIRCGEGNHLLNVRHFSTSKFENLQVQLIVKDSVQNDDDINKVLWEREKYWQAQLFTLRHGLNNPNEWYALKRRVIENNTINFSISDNEIYQSDNWIKIHFWRDMILLVSITLFCNQGCKSESLEERRKIM